MGRDISQVVSEIDALRTVDGDDLDRLRSLMDEYFASPAAANHLDVWFRLFERFPNDDGFESFWTILHGIEAQPGSDVAVVRSVHRRPGHFPVLMVNRMLNGGIRSVAGVDLQELLCQVVGDERLPENVRSDAKRFLEYQRSHA